METRVIIVGESYFSDYSMLCKKVSDVLGRIHGNIRIISGCNDGADKLGIRYAIDSVLPVTSFPLQEETYGNNAAVNRDTEMIKYAADGCNGLVIAFWNGKTEATKSIVDMAKKYNMGIHVFAC